MVKIFFRPGNTGKRMLSWVATERRSGGKSEDPTSRWRVKQAAYLRSKKRGHAKCEENFVRNFTHLPPSKMILQPLILRAYQEYAYRLKLHRPLIKRLIFEAKLSFEALCCRSYKTYTPGLKLRKLFCALLERLNFGYLKEAMI